MKRNIFDRDGANISWCPGCGNFQILDTLKETLADLDLSPENVVIVSGIGQAGKTPHYLSCNMFNGLHGRTLPLATGISAGNPGLTVFAVGGDGDMYGEGGNHFIHAIRRNPDITNIVHNNMVYGLTKGQASPTSQRQFVTPVQVHGVSHEPFNPVAMAITLNASFVARAFSGDKEQTSRILKKAVRHRGYALVDILQPCVTFNKVNTYQWFKDNSYYLEDSYDRSDRMGALERTLGEDRFALGVLYTSPEKPSFEESLPVYADADEPLRAREVNREELTAHIKSKV
jgi:2-oxoglutarate ferredoxin oxidoreductase subunit beta